MIKELWASEHDLPNLSLANHFHHFAYQYLDNVKIIGMQNLIKIYGVIQN